MAPTSRISPWAGAVAASVAAFSLVGSEFLPIGLLPTIAADLRISTGTAGLMVAAPALMAMLSAPACLLLAGRMDRRLLISGLMALLCLSNTITALATNAVVLVLGRALLGVALGAFWTVAGTLGPRLMSGAAGIRANAVILSGISLGTIAGLPAGAALGHLFGWRMAFAAAAVVAGVATLALASLLPWLPSRHAMRPRDFASILTQPVYRARIIGVATLFGGHFAAYTYLAPMAEAAHLSAEALTFALLLNGAAGFLGNLVGGWISASGARRGMLVASGLLIATVLAIGMLRTTPLSMTALIAAWGLFFGMLPIATQTWAQDDLGDAVDVMQSLVVSAIQAAISVGSFLGGVAADHLGLPAAFATGSTLAAVAFVIAWTQRPSTGTATCR